MLTKEVWALKENKNHFQIIDSSDTYSIEIEDADEVAKNFNKFISNGNCNDSRVLEILNYFSILDKNELKNDFEENKWVCNEKPNFYLKQVDVIKNHEKEFFNFHGCLVYIPRNIKWCPVCLIKRIAGLYRHVYSYSDLWNIYPIRISKLSKLTSKLLQMKKHKSICLLEKDSGKISEAKLVSYSDCKICNYKLNNTLNFNLSRAIPTYFENGIRTQSSQDALKILKKNVGLLAPVTSYDIHSSDYKLNLPVAHSKISIDPLKFSDSFVIHGGKGYTEYQAACSAIGEAVERYNAIYRNSDVTYSFTYKELKSKGYDALNPKDMALSNLEENLYKSNIKLDWVKTKQLDNNRIVWVPANYIYFPYIPVDSDKDVFIQDTTGLATGLTFEEAILQGIQEVIERDAYSIYYRWQLDAYDINLQEIKNSQIQHLINYLKKKRISVFLKLLKTDIDTYVVHSVLEDKQKKFPIYTHGSGAALNIDIAIMRAITESIQLRESQSKILKNVSDFSEKSEYDSYVDWGKGNKEKVGNLIRKWKNVNYSQLINKSSGDILSDIDHLTSNLKKKGYKVLIANLSRTDTNLKTVRVLIPGFQPLDDTLSKESKHVQEVLKFLKQKGNLCNYKFFS